MSKPLRYRPTPFGRLLEQLEDRTVPAGNVTAVLSGHTLTLIGDAAGNIVRVLPAGSAGVVAVVGSGTTVNFATQRSFAGVETIQADMRDGSDLLVVQGVSLAGSTCQVILDGGAGDDLVSVIDCTVTANDWVTLQLFGEQVTPTSASGATGNDTLTLSGTLLSSAAGGVNASIVGETVNGGSVTGGNDTITVSDSTLVGNTSTTGLSVSGDENMAFGLSQSHIGGGNDWITVRNTQVTNTNAVHSSQCDASIDVYGDDNAANNYGAPNTPGYGYAAIDGGNDTIDVVGCTVTASGAGADSAGTFMLVFGDDNGAYSSVPQVVPVAVIGSGNDAITVSGCTLTTSGATRSNHASAWIAGEVMQPGSSGGAAIAAIGGGTDVISVSYLTAQSGGGTSDSSSVQVDGDNVFARGGATVNLPYSDDTITLDHVQVTGSSPTPYRTLTVNGGLGGDQVTVTNSSSDNVIRVDLGDGDDDLTFTGNTVSPGGVRFEGGNGHDKLFLSGNSSGPLTILDFEEVSLGP